MVKHAAPLPLPHWSVIEDSLSKISLITSKFYVKLLSCFSTNKGCLRTTTKTKSILKKKHQQRRKWYRKFFCKNLLFKKRKEKERIIFRIEVASGEIQYRLHYLKIKSDISETRENLPLLLLSGEMLQIIYVRTKTSSPHHL